MNKEQFAELAHHKVGRAKDVSGAALDANFYRPVKQLAPENWPYKSQVAPHKMSAPLKRRQTMPGDCAVCGGGGWAEEVKNVQTGSKVYRRCGACEGSGRGNGSRAGG